jgi:ribulose-bisphosphate carboxylase large chain
MRFTVTYRILGNRSEARAKANDICIEQSIEFPLHLVRSRRIKDRVVGKLLSLHKCGTRAFSADIAYAEETAAGELSQFLNVLFGNSSLKPGIRVEAFSLTPRLRRIFPGPRFGVAGIRRLTGVKRRPFICAALKPMGLDARELADLAYRFARGGVDLIKDDHGLSDQVYAPFDERVARVSEAVAKANAETGLACLYAPNVTAGPDHVLDRGRIARRRGAGALVVSPGLAGFPSVLALRQDPLVGLPILSHPALIGSFTVNADSGIAHRALYGLLTRVAGADATIFPNYGGRFSFTRHDCQGIVEGCSESFGGLKPCCPAPGGGITMDRVPELCDFYGRDVIFLMGGGLAGAGDDLEENCQTFRRLVGG